MSKYLEQQLVECSRNQFKNDRYTGEVPTEWKSSASIIASTRDLYPVQERLNMKTVKGKASGKLNPSQIIGVLIKDGVIAIINGHHTLAAKIANGHDQVRITLHQPKEDI